MRVTVMAADPAHTPWSFDAATVTWDEDPDGNLVVRAYNASGDYAGGAEIAAGSWVGPVIRAD